MDIVRSDFAGVINHQKEVSFNYHFSMLNQVLANLYSILGEVAIGRRQKFVLQNML